MKVIYKKSVTKFFEEEVAKFHGLETGGVLLGYMTSDIVYIEKATDAGPNAIHEPSYFKADNNYIEMMIDFEYANSNGEIGYIGEWHTHPQINPKPSELDLISLCEITESSGTINLLLIIGAINFSKINFLDQSISIIKSAESSKFYEINPTIK